MTWRFHDEADAEFIEATLYYTERSPEVGASFVSSVEDALDQIVRMPRSAPAWPGRPDVRRRVLTRFPYAIVYLLERDQIFVVALGAHEAPTRVMAWSAVAIGLRAGGGGLERVGVEVVVVVRAQADVGDERAVVAGAAG